MNIQMSQKKHFSDFCGSSAVITVNYVLVKTSATFNIFGLKPGWKILTSISWKYEFDNREK